MTASIDTDEPDRTHRRGNGAEDFPEAVVDRVAHAIGKDKDACRLLVRRAKTRFHIDRPR